MGGSGTEGGRLWIEAKWRSLLIVAAVSFAIADGLLSLLLIPRLLISLAFFVFASAILLIAATGSVTLWGLRGIRAVAVDAEGLTILRGRRNAALRVPRSCITRVRVRRGPIGPALIVTLERARGRPRRIAIRSDAFAPDDFQRLAAALGCPRAERIARRSWTGPGRSVRR